MTTDPELLVLLEAREAASKPAWHVAFARFGNKGNDCQGRRPSSWSLRGGRARFLRRQVLPPLQPRGRNADRDP